VVIASGSQHGALIWFDYQNGKRLAGVPVSPF
jgi:hypothetical protein